jgi:general secretion pathway protein I
MLLEALVALALLLVFAAVVAPVLFQARHIMSGAGDRVAAQVLLRSLLDVPIDRATLGKAAREGETSGLRWRLTASPLYHVDVDTSLQQEGPNWIPYRVEVTVSWGEEQSVTAETMRLGKPR